MLRSEPTGADVFLGEEKLGVTPLEHEHPFGQAPIELTFRKRGHKPAVERVTPDQKQAIQVRLVPRKKRQRQKTPKKSVFRGDR